MNLAIKSFRRIFCLPGIVLLLLITHSAIAGETGYPIAGTQPDSRPASAPVAPPLNKTNDWYRHAVTGVEEPYPASLQFLENQGRWYTPFTRPGMPGRYDLRGWHAEKH